MNFCVHTVHHIIDTATNVRFEYNKYYYFLRIFVPRVCIVHTKSEQRSNKSNSIKATKRLFCMHSHKI